MKSAVWSLGIVLIEMMGKRPYYWCDNDDLPTKNGDLRLPFDEDDIESEELLDFLKKCFQRKNERCSVSELLNVSVIG